MRRYRRLSVLPLALTLFLVSVGAVFLLVGAAAARQPQSPEELAAANAPDSVTAARLPTTLRDYLVPGTQPGQLTDPIAAPNTCRSCHAGYGQASGMDADQETWTAWAGSMMAQSGRDPLFWAALDVANADAEHSGELCLRCHLPRGWLGGRSTPSDGSTMTGADSEGVQCEVCHRLVDPFPAADNPSRDAAILGALAHRVERVGNASMIVDPLDFRRGPYEIVSGLGLDPHVQYQGARDTLQSPYHQEATLCGTCHDISNPLFNWDADKQEYVRNEDDKPLPAGAIPFPVERTYSEWYLSDYNTPQGVLAPQFGGNSDYVATCQDCHMRAITGRGASLQGDVTPVPVRDDLAWHDLTGANTWAPLAILEHPQFGTAFAADPAREQALLAGVERARQMLQRAATLWVTRQADTLDVTVFNETGHKLPTGYPEGRRMWLEIKGYDQDDNLIYSSGVYDAAASQLAQPNDPDLKVYQVEQGLSQSLAAEVGLAAGHSFHFILNNTIVADNRIPPRGYAYDAFAAAGAAPYAGGMPAQDMYGDGQYWDTTTYLLPAGVTHGTVRLLYQTTSREYVEFLRDNNPLPAPNNGQVLYDLWQATGKSAPEVMAEITFGATTSVGFLPLLAGGS